MTTSSSSLSIPVAARWSFLADPTQHCPPSKQHDYHAGEDNLTKGKDHDQSDECTEDQGDDERLCALSHACKGDQSENCHDDHSMTGDVDALEDSLGLIMNPSARGAARRIGILHFGPASI